MSLMISNQAKQQQKFNICDRTFNQSALILKFLSKKQGKLFEKLTNWKMEGAMNCILSPGPGHSLYRSFIVFLVRHTKIVFMKLTFMKEC